MQSLDSCLMVVGDHADAARQRRQIALYVSAIEGSRVISVERFGPEDEGERGIKHAHLQVADARSRCDAVAAIGLERRASRQLREQCG